MIRKLLKDQRGVVALEFALVLSTVGLACIAGGMVLGPPVHSYASRLTDTVMRAEALADQLQREGPSCTVLP